MICHKCGAQVDDQAAFCDKCGALLQNTRPGAIPATAAHPGVAAGAPAYPTAVQYAGFWKRFAAAIIDGLIFGAIETVIMFILMGAGVVDIGAATADPSSSEYQRYLLVNYVVGGIVFVVQIAYFAIMESSSRQATLGKMVLGIVVTDGDGKRISFGRATGPEPRQDRLADHTVHRLHHDRLHREEAGPA